MQQGPFAPRALPRFNATTDPAATVSSSADFPVVPVIRLTLLQTFLPGTRTVSPVAWPSCPKTQTNSRPAIPKTCKQALLHTGTATSAGGSSTRPRVSGLRSLLGEARSVACPSSLLWSAPWASAGCLRCLLLVICTHPVAKEALTLHLACSEGRKRYFGCNLMHCKVFSVISPTLNGGSTAQDGITHRRRRPSLWTYHQVL